MDKSFEPLGATAAHVQQHHLYFFVTKLLIHCHSFLMTPVNVWLPENQTPFADKNESYMSVHWTGGKHVEKENIYA